MANFKVGERVINQDGTKGTVIEGMDKRGRVLVSLDGGDINTEFEHDELQSVELSDAIEKVYRHYEEMLRAIGATDDEQQRYEEYFSIMLDDVDSMEALSAVVQGMVGK